MAAEQYPKFFHSVVGVAPNKMKNLKAADIEALCDLFHTVTLVDPLKTDRPLADVLKEFRRDLTG